jgi:hypothetical protein
MIHWLIKVKKKKFRSHYQSATKLAEINFQISFLFVRDESSNEHGFSMSAYGIENM